MARAATKSLFTAELIAPATRDAFINIPRISYRDWQAKKE